MIISILIAVIVALLLVSLIVGIKSIKRKEEKKDVLKNDKAGMNIENEEDIPEEEKLEE